MACKSILYIYVSFKIQYFDNQICAKMFLQCVAVIGLSSHPNNGQDPHAKRHIKLMLIKFDSINLKVKTTG